MCEIMEKCPNLNGPQVLDCVRNCHDEHTFRVVVILPASQHNMVQDSQIWHQVIGMITGNSLWMVYGETKKELQLPRFVHPATPSDPPRSCTLM
jgi:hypothetical protein